MPVEKTGTIKCPYCKLLIGADSDFCPNCGELLVEHTFCAEHQDNPAVGVCIICSTPFCKKCGVRTDGHYLCNKHSKYEIYEGMARVYGASDSIKVDFAKDALEKSGLHPFIYSRKSSPISLGGPEYSLFRASGGYNGQIINEFKLMVPCQEVEEAEAIIKELKF